MKTTRTVVFIYCRFTELLYEVELHLQSPDGIHVRVTAPYIPLQLPHFLDPNPPPQIKKQNEKKLLLLTLLYLKPR